MAGILQCLSVAPSHFSFCSILFTASNVLIMLVVFLSLSAFLCLLYLVSTRASCKDISGWKDEITQVQVNIRTGKWFQSIIRLELLKYGAPRTIKIIHHIPSFLTYSLDFVKSNFPKFQVLGAMAFAWYLSWFWIDYQLTLCRYITFFIFECYTHPF